MDSRRRNPQPDLETDALDWSPAAEGKSELVETLAAESIQVIAPIPGAISGEMVTMIHDPFGIQTNEIAEIQQRDDELPADVMNESSDEFAEGDDDFDRLNQAMQKEQSRQIQELSGMHEDQAQRLAAELALQIADDQELSKAIAQEISQNLDADLEEGQSTHVPLSLEEIQSSIEAILFMADKPLSLEKLQEMIAPQQSFADFQEAMTELKPRYEATGFGIELCEIDNGYQLRTKPIRAPLIKRMVRIQTQRLSAGAMETLAIVAYKQPVMKDDIDRIRGVDSSHFVRGLMDRKLIQISGRSDLPGRPILYTTTSDFLTVFGLKDLSAMPSLRELEAMMPSSETRNPDDEDPKVKEIRRLVSQMKADSGRISYDPKEDEAFLQEIRERVGAISVLSPTLEAQKEAEKAAKEAEKAALLAAANPRLADGTSDAPLADAQA